MSIYKLKRQGLSHAERNIECQDVIGVNVLKNGNIILALSDGAGSARYGTVGATENVKCIMEYFSSFYWDKKIVLEDIKKEIIHSCVSRLSKIAQEWNDVFLPHFSATLLFIVVTEKSIYVGHLGDGAIYLVDSNGKCIFESDPENIEVSSKTYFTVSSGASMHFRITELSRDDNDYRIALMMSDGPFLMFKDRGNGNPIETVEEFTEFLLNKEICNDDEMESILDQMTEIELEKNDDWSLIALELDDPTFSEECETSTVSSLGDEECKEDDSVEASGDTIEVLKAEDNTPSGNSQSQDINTTEEQVEACEASNECTSGEGEEKGDTGIETPSKMEEPLQADDNSPGDKTDNTH